MKNNINVDNPRPDEKVCFNCCHFLWLVGIGQGVKCALSMQQLPSRWHTCNKFEEKKNRNSDNEPVI